MADPMRSLVLCMVLLSLGAGALAGVHYVAIDLPAQKVSGPPLNAQSSTLTCDLCKANCEVDPDYYSCMDICKNIMCSSVN